MNKGIIYIRDPKTKEFIKIPLYNEGINKSDFEKLFILYLKKYIDNDTIYWDNTINSIKAKIGSGEDNFIKVSLAINPSDINKVKSIIAENSEKTTITEDKSTYYFYFIPGSTGTIRILANPGFVVLRLNVDKINKGEIDSYTFENILESHTMYLWMLEKKKLNPINFLERSDKPGIYYSGFLEIIDDVIKDYPEKLDKDITITCISKAYYSNPEYYSAIIKDWNKDSMYFLCIDGNNQLTIDCCSTGGFNTRNVDNMIFKNIKFVNTANYVERLPPEEYGALYIQGTFARKCNNFYVYNCNITGNYEKSPRIGRYGIIAKYVNSLNILNSSFSSISGLPIQFRNGGCLAILNSSILTDSPDGSMGHPAACLINAATIFSMLDCSISGESREAAINITNVDYIDIRRNRFHNIAGKAIVFSSNKYINNFNIELNLFNNILESPIYTWDFSIIQGEKGSIKLFKLSNNTFINNSSLWQQWNIRCVPVNIDYAYICNNIICDKTPNSIPMRNFLFGTINNLVSTNNIYLLKKTDDGKTKESIFSIKDNLGKDIFFRTIEEANNSGYEIGSKLIDTNVKLLNNNYSILDNYKNELIANNLYLSELDINYTKKSNINNCGCINSFGIEFNYEEDASLGYTCLDIEENKQFDNSNLYNTFADNNIILVSTNLNKNKLFITTIIGSLHLKLLLGKFNIFKLWPILDSNFEYVEDELYKINVK